MLGLLSLLALIGPKFSVFRWFAILYVFALLPLLPFAGTEAEIMRRHEAPTVRTPRYQAGRYLLSGALSLLNPFVLLQQLRQAYGQILALARPRDTWPSAETTRSAVEYDAPFTGRWLVARGGATLQDSHSWGILSQRFALDLIRVGRDGFTTVGDGSRLADHYAFGAEILAPAAGTVIAIRNDVRDSPFVGSGWLDLFTTDIRGNHVVIRHGEKEYSVVAHLMQGSVQVRPGEEVRRGQLLGRCGNSGYSTEPHLHFQLNDGPEFFTSFGLPIRFGKPVSEGATPLSDFPRTGDLIAGSSVLADAR